MSVGLTSDDGSVAPNSILDRWGETLLNAGDTSGRDFRTHARIKGQLETTGFEEVTEIIYQVPIGSWSEDLDMREVGQWNLARWDQGIEGWSLALLTRVLNVSSLPTNLMQHSTGKLTACSGLTPMWKHFSRRCMRAYETQLFTPIISCRSPFTSSCQLSSR
jgi:hypothetical protein